MLHCELFINRNQFRNYQGDSIRWLTRINGMYKVYDNCDRAYQSVMPLSDMMAKITSLYLCVGGDCNINLSFDLNINQDIIIATYNCWLEAII